MPERPEPPETCAQCGADIPRRAQACPECGADERTGWRESSVYDGMDLPEHAWEDEKPSSRPSSKRINGLAWYWWVVGLLLLGLIAASFLGRR